jgi:DNA-binding Lrp family transcriptional regulator
MNPEKEKEIINHIVKSKYSWWVASVEGIFILHVNLWVKNMSEFIIYWHDILSKYSNYFLKKELFFISESRAYHQSYLLNYEKRDDIGNYEIISSYLPINIDEIDKKILRMLGNNSRCAIVEIAKNTNLSSNCVKKRIKRLIYNNLIQKFRLEIDINKIGYEQFKVHIYLNKYNKIDSIINYLKLNPHLVYINKSAGNADLEISLHHEKIGDLYPIMADLTNNFPGVIRNYIYFHFPKIHKHTNLSFD